MIFLFSVTFSEEIQHYSEFQGTLSQMFGTGNVVVPLWKRDHYFMYKSFRGVTMGKSENHYHYLLLQSEMTGPNSDTPPKWWRWRDSFGSELSHEFLEFRRSVFTLYWIWETTLRVFPLLYPVRSSLAAAEEACGGGHVIKLMLCSSTTSSKSGIFWIKHQIQWLKLHHWNQLFLWSFWEFFFTSQNWGILFSVVFISLSCFILGTVEARFPIQRTWWWFHFMSRDEKMTTDQRFVHVFFG